MFPFACGPLTKTYYGVALGYLYSPASLALIRSEDARGVLAAGCLLGGMDDLCNYAYDVCRRGINLDTIASWLALIDTIQSDGTVSPDSPPLPPSIFGSYAQRFRSDVLHFLIVTLPASLDAGDLLASSRGDPVSLASAPSGRDTLLRIFSQTPFDIFKEAVESPAFQIGGPYSPHILSCNALKIIHMRRRFRASSLPICQRCRTVTQTWYRAQCRCRGGRCPCVLWRGCWWERRACHQEGSSEEPLESQYSVRIVRSIFSLCHDYA